MKQLHVYVQLYFQLDGFLSVPDIKLRLSLFYHLHPTPTPPTPAPPQTQYHTALNQDGGGTTDDMFK